jgi:hypothetical protein
MKSPRSSDFSMKFHLNKKHGFPAAFFVAPSSRVGGKNFLQA